MHVYKYIHMAIHKTLYSFACTYRNELCNSISTWINQSAHGSINQHMGRTWINQSAHGSINHQHIDQLLQIIRVYTCNAGLRAYLHVLCSIMKHAQICSCLGPTSGSTSLLHLLLITGRMQPSPYQPWWSWSENEKKKREKENLRHIKLCTAHLAMGPTYHCKFGKPKCDFAHSLAELSVPNETYYATWSRAWSEGEIDFNVWPND